MPPRPGRLKGRLAPLGQFESYRASLDRAGPPGRGPDDVVIIGSENRVAEGVGRLFDAGASEVATVILSDPENPQGSVIRGGRLIGELARQADA